MGLDERERVQRRLYIRKGERLMLQRVEWAQATGSPVLVESCVSEVPGEIGPLSGRAVTPGSRDESATVTIRRGVLHHLLCVHRLGVGCAYLEQSGRDVPTGRIPERLAG